MVTASFFLMLVTDMDIVSYLSTSYKSVISYSTIRLIIAFVFIMVLENILRNTGMIKRMTESLKELVGSNRAVAGALPIVIGLLPSPGGARFSCPMVEEVAKETSSKVNMTYVNYWFRHAWMDGFMLYPGIILASELLGTNVLVFFSRLFPFMLLTVIVGYFMGLRKIKKEKINATKSRKANIMSFISAISPVFAVILLYISLMSFSDNALEISLFVICTAMFIIKKYSLKQALGVFKTSFPGKLILIIFGVMIFRDVLFATGLLDGLPVFMEEAGIPVYAAFLLLPFISGALTGICVSFVSISFPILLTLGLSENLWYGVLVFVAGYIGMMISPVHLCMVVSSNYFKQSVTSVMRRVMLSEIPMTIIVVCLMILIYTR